MDKVEGSQGSKGTFDCGPSAFSSVSPTRTSAYEKQPVHPKGWGNKVNFPTAVVGISFEAPVLEHQSEKRSDQAPGAATDGTDLHSATWISRNNTVNTYDQVSTLNAFRIEDHR